MAFGHLCHLYLLGMPNIMANGAHDLLATVRKVQHVLFAGQRNHVSTPSVFNDFHICRNTPPCGWMAGWLLGWVGWRWLGWAGWVGWVSGLGWLGWLVGWLVGMHVCNGHGHGRGHGHNGEIMVRCWRDNGESNSDVHIRTRGPC